jgi:hypothetical protein
MLLSVPMMKTLKAFLQMTVLLNCQDNYFEPHAQRVINPAEFPNLPAFLRPTPAQISIPHHPSLDVIPWPSVRTKLILLFSLPPALRPPIARDMTSALQQITYDLDDMHEGVRIHGGTGTGMSEDEWEVGQAFFRNWWWCLESATVAATNRKRMERGEGKLRLEDTSSATVDMGGMAAPA